MTPLWLGILDSNKKERSSCRVVAGGETGRLNAATLAPMNDAAELVAVTDSIRILQSVRRIAQCVEHHSKRLTATHNITSPQLVALMAIAQLGPSTLKSIGRAIHLSPSTVVGIVDRLEEKGLVRRERDTRGTSKHRGHRFIGAAGAGSSSDDGVRIACSISSTNARSA